MSRRWLILADDLTGAADCAITFAKQGADAVVAWADEARAKAEVLAVDVDSRRFPAAEAAARQVAAMTAHWQPELRLYKKIDSTLRGQPAAELAVQLRVVAATTGKRAPLAIMAPAFPATGRVTLGGRVVVNGEPLEQTPLWARDHTYANADLVSVLASAGLKASVIDLDTIHAGSETVHDRMAAAAAAGYDAVVCDCVQVADLGVVAQASLLLDEAVWVGSAGLAAALAGLTAPDQAAVKSLPSRRGGVLMVVGSLAEASRQQARLLAQAEDIRHVLVSPETLLGSTTAPAWGQAQAALTDALASGGDVLLEIALAPNPDLARGPEIAARLAVLVDPVAGQVGALVATGGDTACALLSHLGVHAIRLVDEVEPGVPLGITQGRHALPVVTKAGAFGDADTLRRCLRRLKQ